MKIITYAHSQDGLDRLGSLNDTQITPLSLSPADFYAQGISALPNLTPSGEPAIAMDEVIIRPVVPAPSKIVCVGLNYRKHAEESGMTPPPTPVLFSKFNNALAGHNEAVPIASGWEAVDYEAELVVVIGKKGRYIAQADALSYVLGYTCGNDLSERNLQLKQPSGQWLIGKTPDKFMPIGHCLVTADDIPNPQNLSIKGWLNGELRQNSHTSDMIFSVAHIIAYASTFFTLNVGDIISTGTPQGVILGMAEKHYMQAGDTYTVEIDGIGKLTNTLVKEE
ncbi:MAG: fumarylacetoacetate hydrolase family protein [bacterium]|nr:fumarylacetoacetate hydrolase family protein [bacterium]